MKWQKCPKCEGNKQIARWCGTQTRLVTCPTCKGVGVIQIPTNPNKKD